MMMAGAGMVHFFLPYALEIILRVMTRIHKIKGCKFLYDNEKQVC